MLSQALTPLKQDIEKLLNSSSTAEAFEKALLTTFGPDAVDDDDFKKIAADFGKVAALHLSRSISEPLGDAIDKYVKQIGFIIAPSALMSPFGPVTGVITSSDIQQVI